MKIDFMLGGDKYTYTHTPRERAGWLTEPAQEGDIVEIKNPGGRAWRRFICERGPKGSLWFREAVPGETRKLVGSGGYTAVGYEYNGVKRVVK